MDDGSFTPPNPPPMFGNVEYNLMDQLLDQGCWLQTDDGSNFLQPGPSNSRDSIYSSYPLPLLEGSPSPSTLPSVPLQSCYQEEGERWNLSHTEQPQYDSKTVKGDQKTIIKPALNNNPYVWQGDELNKFLWIGPKANPGPSTPVKDRLMNALGRLRDINENRDVLIQIWVPIKKGLKSFLTTVRQPHFCHPTSQRLQLYRVVSESYEFLADEDTKEALGLPGRVFLGKAPEWTPNVRFFKEEEYPRIDFAHKYDVRGSIALPVFERGNGDCLGVVEIITTTDKINYRPEVESVCKALQSVDLRSSGILNALHDKGGKGTHEMGIVLHEISTLLKIVCNTHDLPLAQTWAPCTQQGKDGCWHSDRSSLCVSTVDFACYIRDQRVLDFNKACCEHHLLKGQGGIVGRAFETYKPCFATDVTEFSKVEYPLSHHAKVSELRAAIALRLHSIFHESWDYVLEFFLPTNSQETGLTFHNRVWQSVTTLVQQQCRSLYFVRFEDVDEQNLLGGEVIAGNEMKTKSSNLEQDNQEKTSWFSEMMNPQRKGKEVAASLEFGAKPRGEVFNVTHWSNTEPELQLGQAYSDCGNTKLDSGLKGKAEDIGGSQSRGRLPLTSKKFGKKRTKTQKTISLQVLRQYFAGSLKDAAKSMGVCPTTLKRICRQHGITRWPSRKIKKVGHSLQKLQLVMDSVQGSEGAIKISSFYSNFPELNSPNIQPSDNQILTSNMNNQQKQQHTNQPDAGYGGSTSNSPSTSSSQTSNSSQCFTNLGKISSPVPIKGTSTAEDPSGSLKRAQSDAELQALSKKETDRQILERSHSNKTLVEPSLPENPTSLPLLSKSWPSRDASVFKAKATFGEEKARFTISQNMRFKELQQEIAKRFNFENVNKIGMKYLDDDKEWVLLTCDADLEECIYIHKSLRSHHTIKLTLSNNVSNVGGSFGSSGLS